MSASLIQEPQRVSVSFQGNTSGQAILARYEANLHTVIPGMASPDSSGEPPVLSKLTKWGNYPSFGSPLPGTKFIPMKTPLSEVLQSEMEPAPKHKLTLGSFLKEQENFGRVVGMVIDLCNHSCLYTEDIPEGLGYQHISLVAKEVPARENILEVIKVAEGFWTEHPDQYIAVHCAYGFNRTGFTLSSYLVEKLNYTAEEALSAFAVARPPGVKHQRFQAEFNDRYKISTQVGTLPTYNVRNPSGCGHQASLRRGSKKDIKGSFREKLSQIVRTVCSRGWMTKSNPSARGSVGGHLPGLLPEVSTYSIKADGNQQLQQAYDENESLGPVERQALVKFRRDMIQKCRA